MRKKKKILILDSNICIYIEKILNRYQAQQRKFDSKRRLLKTEIDTFNDELGIDFNPIYKELKKYDKTTTLLAPQFAMLENIKGALKKYEKGHSISGNTQENNSLENEDVSHKIIEEIAENIPLNLTTFCDKADIGKFDLVKEQIKDSVLLFIEIFKNYHNYLSKVIEEEKNLEDIYAELNEKEKKQSWIFLFIYGLTIFYKDEKRSGKKDKDIDAFAVQANGIYKKGEENFLYDCHFIVLIMKYRYKFFGTKNIEIRPITADRALQEFISAFFLLFKINCENAPAIDINNAPAIDINNAPDFVFDIDAEILRDKPWFNRLAFLFTHLSAH